MAHIGFYRLLVGKGGHWYDLYFKNYDDAANYLLALRSVRGWMWWQEIKACVLNTEPIKAVY